MKEIDLTLDRGDDEYIVFTAKNKCKLVDVTSARFSVRIKPHEQKGEVIELTSDNGAIAVKEKSNVVIKIPRATTATMTANRYVYTLRITVDDTVKTLASGFIDMRQGV